MAARSGKRQLPVERVLARKLDSRDVNLDKSLRDVELLYEIFVHRHSRDDVAHYHGVEPVLGADDRIIRRHLRRLEVRNLVGDGGIAGIDADGGRHYFLENTRHAAQLQRRLRAARLEGDIVRPSVDKREDARLDLVERALLAETVGSRYHLGDERHVARRTGDHDKFVVGGCLEREPPILDAEFREHGAHLAGFHVLQVDEHRRYLSRTANIQCGAVVVPHQVVGSGDPVEKIAGRHILEIAREPAHDGLGHYDRKTLGDRKSLKSDAEIHVARDKRVGRQLPWD